ncbi:MAG: hypothetical protein ACJAVI_000574 [Candidatus Azotimanducaceae bacterium]
MSSGYQIEEICPPELPLINELWGLLLSKDIAALLHQVDGVLSDDATWMLKDFLDIYQPNNQGNQSAMAVLHAERSSLRGLWSEFFLEYPAIVGPV